MQQREPAICLRTSDYSETSQVLLFLTRGAGAVRLLAKGAKRPKSRTGGAIDLLSEGDLVFIATSRQTLGTLVEFSEASPHPGLRKDGRRLNTAIYMIELVGDLLAEADPHPVVFDLLHSALARLEQPESPVAAVLAYFHWRLLRHVGLLGDLTACASCGAAVAGEAKDACFSSAQGGLLCAACEGAVAEKYRVDGETLAGTAVLVAAEAGARVSLPEKQALSVCRLLAYHTSQQLGRSLRMARHAIG
jgi:DNA repair protein RecO (recombination protein O)